MKQLLSFALLLVLFISCSKEKSDDLVVLDGRLKKQYFHKNADQVRTYFYDKNGNLRKSEFAMDNVLLGHQEFVYSNNRLKTIVIYDRQNPNSIPQFYEQRQLEYDKNGRLIEIQFKNNTQPSPWPSIVVNDSKWEFGYEDEHAVHFNSCKIYQNNGKNDELFSERIFGFENGNIAFEDYYVYLDGERVKRGTTLHEYTPYLNPKYQLDDPLDFVSFFSTHIPKKSTYISVDGEETVTSLTDFQLDLNNKVIEYVYNADASLGNKRYFEYY